jgi:hypothetical protein
MSFSTYYNQLFIFASDIPVIDTLKKYPLLIEIFEKHYCCGEPYKESELVYWVTDKLILEYEDIILKTIRKNKIKQLKND